MRVYALASSHVHDETLDLFQSREPKQSYRRFSRQNVRKVRTVL
jgi:hypothetical protein